MHLLDSALEKLTRTTYIKEYLENLNTLYTKIPYNTSANKNNGSEILKFIENNLENIILIVLVILLFLLLFCLLRKYFINIRRGIKRSQEDIERLSNEIKKRKIDNRTVVNNSYAKSFENNDYLYDTLANTIIENVDEEEYNTMAKYVNIDYDKDNSSSV